MPGGAYTGFEIFLCKILQAVEYIYAYLRVYQLRDYNKINEKKGLKRIDNEIWIDAAAQRRTQKKELKITDDKTKLTESMEATRAVIWECGQL